MEITTKYLLELNGEQLIYIVRCLEAHRRAIYVNTRGQSMERDLCIRPIESIVTFLRKRTDELGLYQIDDYKGVEVLRTMPYDEYLTSDHWKFVRGLALERDEYKCRLCGIREGLQVHHANYDHRGQEDQYLNDLVTLCGNCHATFHGKIPV